MRESLYERDPDGAKGPVTLARANPLQALFERSGDNEPAAALRGDGEHFVSLDAINRPEVRVALPGLIADTVASPELHSQMIARLAGDLTAFESRFGQERRGDDRLPMLAEVVAGTAIFRILIRSDAALDDAWVEEMVELITERWPST